MPDLRSVYPAFTSLRSSGLHNAVSVVFYKRDIPMVVCHACFLAVEVCAPLIFAPQAPHSPQNLPNRPISLQLAPFICGSPSPLLTFAPSCKVAGD